MSTSNFDLQGCYSLLNLPIDASLEQVEKAYFKCKTEKILENDRQALPMLKEAYLQIKAALAEQVLTPLDSEPSEQTMLEESVSPAEWLKLLLEKKGFKQVRVKFNGSKLTLELSAAQMPKASKGFIKIHPILTHLSQSDGAFRDIRSVQLLAKHGSKIRWQKQFKLQVQESEEASQNLFSFDSRVTQTWIFPIVMLLAIAMNGIPMVKFLLRGINIWMHEFGHATVAWMSGRKAIPLPFGWTNVELDKSWFVYFGFLTLFGLLFWAGYKEKRRWPMVLALVFTLIQFWMTWIMSEDTFYWLLSFGGIGGEFYLCTFLMVSFYFQLPDYFKWDMYRYPVVLGSAFTFWGSFWTWQQIDRGKESIPWGTLWGGQDHAGGDMNIISASGWSDQQIIDTYNTLGSVCLIVLLSVYFFFLLKQHRQAVQLFWESCLAMF